MNINGSVIRLKKNGYRRPKGYHAPRTAAELVSRYQNGERSFPETVLGDESIDTSLPGIDLRYSSLRIIFNDIDLTKACFHGADLAFTHFDAKLVEANFENADLTWADFGSSDLTGANLRGTDLRHTHFEAGVLDSCDFSGATLEHTNFLDVSLLSICKASGVIHEAPSNVDYRAIVRSVQSPQLKNCLSRMGMPAVFIEYMVDCARSLSETSVFNLLRSTFISYGEPDRRFAQRLYEALHANGVRTFFFPLHALPGIRLHRVMRDSINKFDRVILICSQKSLTRKGVLNEIEETLQRETRDGGASYLIPIRLDDYIFETKSDIDPLIGQAIRDRVVADFTKIDKNPDKFNFSLQKLIAALRKDS